MEIESTDAAPRPPYSRKEAVEKVVGNRDVSFFFDFDGTLSPIVPNPSDAKPLSGITDKIKDLCSVAGRVCVVSARPVDFLQKHFSSLPVDLFGLYGLEWSIKGESRRTDERVQEAIALVNSVRMEAESTFPSQFIEDKRISVALHYRQVPDLAHAMMKWAEDIANKCNLETVQGRMVVEIRPAVQRNKGNVIAEQVTPDGQAWYFGDDVGDIPAFSQLIQMEREHSKFCSVRVLVDNTEAGDKIRPFTDFSVPGPDGLLDLVLEILRSIRRLP